VTALTFWLAALLPGLLAAHVPPSSTVYNQAVAWLSWGIVAVYGLRGVASPLRSAAAYCAVLLSALGLIALAALASWGFGALPATLAWSGAATVVAAMAVAMLGAATPTDERLLKAWFGAWLAAGLAGAAVALVQVFAPDWADGDWIARSSAGGRAVGNVRQPNHLASLLLWGAVSLIPLVELGLLVRTRLARAGAVTALALIVFAVMLTGSRTGAVGVLCLAFWGLLDRRLSRFSRGLLIAAPLIFGLAWWLTGVWSAMHQGPVIGVAQRVGQPEVTSGRLTMWLDTLAMIAEQPLAGVGFGEFNRAWTLTPFPSRPPEFFDHSHNSPLHLLVELGLPLGLLVLGLLAWALWQAWARARDEAGAVGAGRRTLVAMLLLMGLHSLLEYPLWYAHFLLPTAFAWGLCLHAGRAPSGTASRWPLGAGVALVVATGVILFDYHRVSVIFAPQGDATPLEQRIAEGQRSWFFAHHADYARITTFEEVSPPTLADFGRATHFLLDTRLLIAWANAHARAGDVERARWIADRLRELKQSSAAPYFAPCTDSAVVDKPYQCTSASRTFSWRDFK
jgi:O-antigen ligase